MSRSLNSVMLITFIGWHGLVNSFFGWNLFPKSEAELICDGIFLLGLSVLMVAPKETK